MSPKRDAFIEAIHKAQFKKLPTGFQALTEKEIETIRDKPLESGLLPKQEPGVRRSCPLPYELEVEGTLDKEKNRFTIHFKAKKETFGKRAAGKSIPCVRGWCKTSSVAAQNYTVAAGDHLEDSWPLDAFEKKVYHLRVHGPNGFFREFKGDGRQSKLDIRLDYERIHAVETGLTGNVRILCHNGDNQSKSLWIRANAYQNLDAKRIVAPGEGATFEIDTSSSFGWYDLSVLLADDPHFEQRYAGRVEDRQMGFPAILQWGETQACFKRGRYTWVTQLWDGSPEPSAAVRTALESRPTIVLPCFEPGRNSLQFLPQKRCRLARP